jgi:hypothetical protein
MRIKDPLNNQLKFCYRFSLEDRYSQFQYATVSYIMSSMSNPDKKTPGRPRSIQSDQAILQATIELLAEVGFEKMSIEAIADRARVGKTTIYRRYASKAELVADVIESIPEEIMIPDTGNIQGDIDTLMHNAACITLSPLGRQILAMTISSTASNTKFAQIY